MMEEKYIDIKTIIAALFEVIFIIIAIALLSNLLQPTEVSAKIHLNNLESTIPEIPKDQREDISRELYNIAAQNTENSKFIKNFGATIRESTIEKESNSGSFIVDIDDLQESYLVQYRLKGDDGKYDSGYPTLITCPKKSLRIYENQSCEDNFSPKTLEELLPYSDTTSSGQFFSIVKGENFSPKKQSIIIMSSICDNYQSTSEEINSKVQAWINDQEIDISKVPITNNFSCFTQK